MARLAGPGGLVAAVDIQAEMLAGTKRRLARSGISDRVSLHLLGTSGLMLGEKFDFALAFWMLHEVPDRLAMLVRVRDHLKPGGKFLMVEPKMHVSKKAFEETVEIARKAGLVRDRDVRIFASRGVLMVRNGTDA